MKVYISKYRNHWYSPYTFLEKVFFWKDWAKPDGPMYPEWVEKSADKLEPISKGIQWVLDKLHPRVNYVKIDRWDTWSMDTTLAPIILPMLKQLRDTKHGSPYVEMEDVPEAMRTTTTEDYEAQQCFEFYHEDKEKRQYDIHDRWDWVMGEMIFAFEHLVDESWADEFCSGEHDIVWVKEENGLSRMERGPNDTYQCDYEGMEKVRIRMENGFRLFGKYYRGLWD